MPINIKKSKMGDVVKDFYKSDAPQFKGKSKSKRREMAIAAKLSSQEESVNMELEESRAASWQKVQGMDKGSLVGGADARAKRMAYLKAKHDHYKKHGGDAKKVADQIGKLNNNSVRNEEVVQVDELKKSTLQSYIKKASKRPKTGDWHKDMRRGASQIAAKDRTKGKYYPVNAPEDGHGNLVSKKYKQESVEQVDESLDNYKKISAAQYKKVKDQHKAAAMKGGNHANTLHVGKDSKYGTFHQTYSHQDHKLPSVWKTSDGKHHWIKESVGGAKKLQGTPTISLKDIKDSDYKKRDSRGKRRMKAIPDSRVKFVTKKESVENLEEGAILDAIENFFDLFKTRGDYKLIGAVKEAMKADPEFAEIVKNGIDDNGVWKRGYRSKFEKYVQSKMSPEDAKKLGFTRASQLLNPNYRKKEQGLAGFLDLIIMGRRSTDWDVYKDGPKVGSPSTAGRKMANKLKNAKFRSKVSEDVDQIDEISRSALNRYVDGAMRSKDRIAQNPDATTKKDHDTLDKRRRGITRAHRSILKKNTQARESFEQFEESVNIHVRADHLDKRSNTKVNAVLRKHEKAGHIRYDGASDKGTFFVAKSDTHARNLHNDLKSHGTGADTHD